MNDMQCAHMHIKYIEEALPYYEPRHNSRNEVGIIILEHSTLMRKLNENQVRTCNERSDEIAAFKLLNEEMQFPLSIKLVNV